MIIDFHCHASFGVKMPHDRLLTLVARQVRRAAIRGVQISVEEAAARLEPLTREPYDETIIRGMDEAGIDVSVFFFTDSIDGGHDDESVIAQNRNVAELAKKHPKRIIQFAGVDPRRKKGPELLQRCIEEFGVKGLKLHPDNGYSPASEESYRLFEVLQKHNLILLTHTGIGLPPRRNKYSHPFLLDDVSVDFPKLKIVAAHCSYPLQSDWCAISHLNDNIYGDLAEWQLEAAGKYERFCRNVREMIDFVGANKILFATDWPAFEPYNPAKEWVRIIQRLPYDAPPGIKFTTNEVNAILGGNAKKLLGI